MSDKNIPELNAFYDRVKKQAKKSGLTLGETIEKVGLKKGSYDSYKKCGNFPRADEAYRIAKVLGVTVEYLVSGEELPTKPVSSKKMPADVQNSPENLELELRYRVSVLQEKATKIAAIGMLRLLQTYEKECLRDL